MNKRHGQGSGKLFVMGRKRPLQPTNPRVACRLATHPVRDPFVACRLSLCSLHVWPEARTLASILSSLELGDTQSLCALITSPPRNRFTILLSSSSCIEYPGEQTRQKDKEERIDLRSERIFKGFKQIIKTIKKILPYFSPSPIDTFFSVSRRGRKRRRSGWRKRQPTSTMPPPLPPVLHPPATDFPACQPTKSLTFNPSEESLGSAAERIWHLQDSRGQYAPVPAACTPPIRFSLSLFITLKPRAK